MSDYVVPAGNLAKLNLDYVNEVNQVLDLGSLIGGEFVAEFESTFAEYLGSQNIISTASGMDALILALTALDLPKGSNVLVANNAGGYASLATLAAGHNPVYCDIDETGYLLNVRDLEEWTGKVNAVIVTHLYGKMLDMTLVLEWARPSGVKIIEDCAQAVGAILNGKKAGTFGDLGCYSFYPTKNLGGIGDGGAVATADPVLAKKIRQLANYGWSSRYNIEVSSGRNSRLDAINAVVLSKKLDLLNQKNEKRRQILRKYINELKPHSFMIDTEIDESHVAHLAPARAEDPNSLIVFCRERRIQVTRHYPLLDSEQQGLNPKSSTVETPFARKHCARVVNLPIYPELTDEQVSHVIRVVLEWHERER